MFKRVLQWFRRKRDHVPKNVILTLTVYKGDKTTSPDEDIIQDDESLEVYVDRRIKDYSTYYGANVMDVELNIMTPTSVIHSYEIA